MKYSVQSFVLERYSIISKETFLQDFSNNSEAFHPELVQHFEEMFLWYYVLCLAKYDTTY